MHFLLHGSLPPTLSAALVQKDQTPHTLAELAAKPAAPPDPAALADPAVLLPLLDITQWHLLTTDAAFVRGLYEKKLLFRGIIVLLLPDPADNPLPIPRLFERYKRLTPGRLYTITPNRVKIRQLPGAAGAAGHRA
jgi:hypothetical protein